MTIEPLGERDVYDGQIDSIYALAVLLALPLAIPAMAFSFQRSLKTLGVTPLLGGPLEQFGAFSFIAASVLIPLNVFTHVRGGGAWLFGSQTYDGGVVETLTAGNLIGIAVLSALLAARSPAPRMLRGGLALLAAASVFVLLEEMSYGQHLLGWEATGVFAEANRQQETNLHNFVSPRVYDPIYLFAGAVLICASVLSLKPGPWVPRAFRRAVTAFGRAPWAVPLTATAGVLLIHEAFEELSEFVATAAVLYGLGTVLRAEGFVEARPERRLAVTP